MRLFIAGVSCVGKTAIGSKLAELLDYQFNVVKKSKGLTIALNDKPDNILKLITFYDKDSKPVKRHLTKDIRAFFGTK